MNNLKILTINDISELVSIRSDWQRMQCHPNVDYDFYMTTLMSRMHGSKPLILLVYMGDKLISMVIGRLEDREMDFRLGYKKIYASKVKCLLILYGGFLGYFDDHVYEKVVDEFIRILKTGSVDLVTLSWVNDASTLFNIARKRPMWYSRDYVYSVVPHYTMELPTEVEQFYARLSSKHRYWLKRMERSLEKDYEGKIRFQTFTKEDELEELLMSAEFVAKNTYQRGLGVGFLNNDETHSRLYLSAAKGWLLAIVLYVDDQPVAFWIGTLYKDVFHLNYTGYLPSFQKYEVGTLVFLKVIENCIRSNVPRIDFGFGDAFYKKRFGDSVSNEVMLNIYACRPTPMKISILNILINGSTNCVRRGLKKYNIESKIKKMWRQHLRN